MKSDTHIHSSQKMNSKYVVGESKLILHWHPGFQAIHPNDCGDPLFFFLQCHQKVDIFE